MFPGNVLVRIRVTRDDLGNWEVFSDPAGNSDFSSEGPTFQDDTFVASSYFGVVCKHSATRKDLFYFDDFPYNYMNAFFANITCFCSSV